jgi:hypothetical protein
LFHLSFSPNLQGRWTPKIPDSRGDLKTLMTEPIYPRICLSGSLEKCFYAIYPNVSRFFEVDNYPHMDMYVYTPVIGKLTKVVTNEKIVADKLVHDAHMTDEYFITSPVSMTKHSAVRILNCVKNPEVWYHPYNDSAKKKRFLCHETKIETLKIF